LQVPVTGTGNFKRFIRQIAALSITGLIIYFTEKDQNQIGNDA
jgi:hypothetical protein